MAVNAEQVGKNDAIYRDANERIKRAAEDYDVSGPLPFICECADPECRSVVLLTMTEYEEIRAHPTHFLNLPEHTEGEEENAETVRRARGYIVVEKIGQAGEVVNGLDPRQARHG
jgi:hypothetical protein